MVEIGTVAELSKVSIRMSAAFAVIGVGLLYLYIGVSDATTPIKVLANCRSKERKVHSVQTQPIRLGPHSAMIGRCHTMLVPVSPQTAFVQRLPQAGATRSKPATSDVPTATVHSAFLT